MSLNRDREKEKWPVIVFGVLLARSMKTLHAGRRICGCCIRRFGAQTAGSAQIGVLEFPQLP